MKLYRIESCRYRLTTHGEWHMGLLFNEGDFILDVGGNRIKGVATYSTTHVLAMDLTHLFGKED